MPVPVSCSSGCLVGLCGVCSVFAFLFKIKTMCDNAIDIDLSEKLQSRLEKLEELTEFTENCQKKLDGLFAAFGWSPNTDGSIAQLEPTTVCPYDFHHIIPKQSLEKHVAFCRLNKLGYSKEEQAEMYDSSVFYEKANIPTMTIDRSLQSQIILQAKASEDGKNNQSEYSSAPVEVPENHKRAICDLTVADRLAIYNHVIAETSRQKSKTESSENDDLYVDLADKLKRDEDLNCPKSHLEVLAEMRDYKRRRQSYRAKNVHITKKSYTEGARGNTGDPGKPGKPGPQGLKGPPGSQGETGPDGEKGQQGSTGIKGAEGDKGSTGFQGDKGQRGERGSSGPDGPLGRNGPPGIPGTRGESGPSGDSGDVGAAGAKGVQGPPGPALSDAQIYELCRGVVTAQISQHAASIRSKCASGCPINNRVLIGPPGSRGLPGPPGKPGKGGLAGKKGTQGKRGPIGVEGMKGAPGEQGSKGEKGETGDRGTGLPGHDGHQGPRGLPGFAGVPKNGIPGLEGPRGHSGPTGRPGLPGSAGVPGHCEARDCSIHAPALRSEHELVKGPVI